MRKKFARFFLVSIGLILFGMSSSVMYADEHGDGNGNPPAPPVEITAGPHRKPQIENAFRGDGMAKDALLFRFQIFTGHTLTIEKLTLRLVFKGDKVVSGENYRLYKDLDKDSSEYSNWLNPNGEITPGVDEEVGGKGKVQGNFVVFSEPFISAAAHFLVVADFPHLPPGFKLFISLDPRRTIIKDSKGRRVNVKLKRLFYSGEHIEPSPMIQIAASLASPVFVGQQDVTVFVDVAYLRGVEPSWDDLRSVSGWIIRGLPTMSEIAGFGVLRRRTTLKLMQPAGMQLGEHIIPELTLRYRDTVGGYYGDEGLGGVFERGGGGGGEIRTIRTKALTVRKELAAASVAVPRHTVAMAYPITYGFRLFLDPDHVVPKDYLDEIRFRKFRGDFYISEPKVRVIEGQDVNIVDYRAILSYFGPPTKEVVLPKENVPYARKGDIVQAPSVYTISEVRFPFHSLATEKEPYDPVDLWRDVVEDDTYLFGYPIGLWATTLPMSAGGILLVLSGGRGAVRIFGRRRVRTTSLLRRLRVRMYTFDFLAQLTGCDTVYAYDISYSVRRYAGVMSGVSDEYVHSAHFNTWFKERYPKEQSLFAIVNRVERCMLQTNTSATVRLQKGEWREIRRGLKRVARAEWRRRMQSRISWLPGVRMSN